LGVVPSLPGDRRAALDAVCAALSKLIGAEVRGEVPETYAELADGLERDRVHYAWMSPALMVLTAERIQLQALLSAVRNERTEYCSGRLVDARGRARSIAALGGRPSRGSTRRRLPATSCRAFISRRVASIPASYSARSCSCALTPRSCVRCSTVARISAR